MTGKYPLSGVLACGNPACSRQGTMAGYPRTGGRRAYICAVANGGCGQSVLAEPVEELVRDKVLEALADAERLEAMRAADAGWMSSGPSWPGCSLTWTRTWPRPRPSCGTSRGP